MKKISGIILLAVLAVLVFEYLTTPRVKVEDAVRPYVERCLNLIIEKNNRVVFETYLQKRTLSFDDFSDRMGYFVNIFGAEPESFSYLRAYVGGVGYFMQYNLALSDGKTVPCSFAFPAKEGSPVGVKDLQSMSISADMGEKSFTVNFGTGTVLACKAPDGCYGEN